NKLAFILRHSFNPLVEMLDDKLRHAFNIFKRNALIFVAHNFKQILQTHCCILRCKSDDSGDNVETVGNMSVERRITLGRLEKLIMSTCRLYPCLHRPILVEAELVLDDI